MKILLISCGVLPIPAVKGGAVETLIDTFLEYNEKKYKNDVVVCSCYDYNSSLASRKYNYSKFCYVNTNKAMFKIKKVFRGLINKLPGILISNAYINEVIKKVKHDYDISSFDLVLIENVPNYVLPLYKNFGNKIILHSHNDFLNSNTKKGKEILNKCKKIITVSDHVKSKIQAIDIYYKDIYTLINGVDHELFNPSKFDKKSIRKNLKLNDNDVVLFYSGRLVPEKGIKELIICFIGLKKKFSNLKLLIAGSSFFGNNLKKTSYIKELECICKDYQNDIIFTGYVDYNKMPEVYMAADIQVIPSIIDDSCPLSVIEGICMGLPQVATISGGIPELVTNKQSILVNRDNLEKELYDALEKLLNDPELIKKMSHESIKHCHIYKKDIYAQRLNSLLKERN